ncbi:glycosyltransferase family 2 protein, partial [Candidatus Berkelbacteria bacterium]|nr:glycosyltransferase family 2 protein [Candidatus Berkelbacteria bacterium]
GRRWSWLYQVGKPIREFADRFIRQRGFLDGVAGFHVAWISAYGRCLAAAHLRELEERASSR